MKILWVEDGGGNLAISDAIISLFGELVPKRQFMKDYDFDESVEIELRRFFARHSAHEITVCRSYDDWAMLDENDAVDFDAAILDINLEERHQTGNPPISVKDFDKRAGLFIYNELIRKHRFSDDNVAFFTGETGTLDTFVEATVSGMLRPPKHCFEKKKADYEKISGWLKQRASSPYLSLRRGILDSCSFCKERLEDCAEQELPSSFPLFAPADSAQNTDRNGYRDRLQRYLHRLETGIPMEEPVSLQGLYSDILTNLTSPWVSPQQNHPNFHLGEPATLNAGSQFRRSAPKMLRLVHDWAVRDLLSSSLSEDFTAFLCLVAFRSLFSWPTAKPLPHEVHLLDLLGKSSTKTIGKWLDEDLEALLAASYEEISAIVEPSSRRDLDYLALCELFGSRTTSHSPERREAAYEEMESQSLELLHRCFWHGLAPVWADPYLDSIFLTFQVPDLEPGELLHEVASRLAPSSFESIMKPKAA